MKNCEEPRNEKKLTPIDRVAALLGGRKVVAEAVGVSVAAIGNWKLRGQTPAKIAVQLEFLVEKKVSRRELRPHDWQEHWPELAEEKTATPEPSSQETAGETVYCTQPELPLETPESPVSPLDTAPNATENVAQKAG